MALYGVEETKKVLFLLVEIGNMADAMVQAKKDGANTLQMLAKVVMLGDEIYEIIRLDWKTLKAEIKEINSEDMDALVVAFGEKFQLTNEEVTVKIEKGVKLLDTLGDTIVDIIDFAKEFKK